MLQEISGSKEILHRQCNFCSVFLLSEEGTRSHSFNCRHASRGPLRFKFGTIKFRRALVRISANDKEICDQRTRPKQDNGRITGRPRSSTGLVNHGQTVIGNDFKPIGDVDGFRILKDPSKSFEHLAKCILSGEILRVDSAAGHRKFHTKRLEISKPKPKPFQCPVCQIGLKNRKSLRRHFVIHLENNPFKCTFPNCVHRCHCLNHLQMHVRRHYEKAIMTCDICGVSYRASNKLGTNSHKCRFDPSRIVLGLGGKKFSKRSIPKLAGADDTPTIRLELENTMTILNTLPRGSAALSKLIANDPVYHRIVKEKPEIQVIMGIVINSKSKNCLVTTSKLTRRAGLQK